MAADYSSSTNKAIPGSHGVSPEPCPRAALGFSTLCAHGFTRFDGSTGAVAVPIVQSATFAHPSFGESTGFDYARGLHPTRLELERTVAAMERCDYALAFSSGMAAVSCFLKRFSPGDEIVVCEDLYGGTWRMFKMYEDYGIKFTYVDTSKFDLLEKSVTEGTKVLFVETPSNPMMRVTDIRRCADLIHSVGGVLAVDNTFLTPFLQNPMDFGADFVIHSATKYLGGHNDAVAGILCYNGAENDEFFRAAQMAEGACLSAFDSFLILRGIKTLPLRMGRSEENARRLAEFLRQSPKVEKVYYAGFPDSPNFDVSRRQSRGFGAMISFRVGSGDAAVRILDSLRVIMFAESLGGVQTLMTYPVTQTHAAIPEEIRASLGVDERLLRLSVGIEDAEDLLADLEGAFRSV